ncbi:hypothetical protein BJX70DRAFT_69597 [Aspergillus crustosus]
MGLEITPPAAEPIQTSPSPSPTPPSTATAVTHPTSTALTYIPTTILSDPLSTPPTYQNIHPWDLPPPVIPLTSPYPIYYSAATQEYHLFTTHGALLIHKTSPITIPKKQARTFLYDFPHRSEAVSIFIENKFGHLGFQLPGSDTALIPDIVVIYHAIHDSVFVKRRSGDTSLFQYCVDKWLAAPNVGVLSLDVYVQLMRPGFGHVLDHVCESLYYCGNTLYCPTCTTYRSPLSITKTITTTPPIILGRVTLPIPVARSILAQCFVPGSMKLDMHRAYLALGKCFNMRNLAKIDVPEAEMVGNLLRSCLFVDVGNVASTSTATATATATSPGAKKQKQSQNKTQNQARKGIISWANFFNISKQDLAAGAKTRGADGVEYGHGKIDFGSVTVAAAEGGVVTLAEALGTDVGLGL